LEDLTLRARRLIEARKRHGALSHSPNLSSAEWGRGTIAFDGRRSRDVANRDDRFGYPVGARGTIALAT
jgi:hypothetical protein